MFAIMILMMPFSCPIPKTTLMPDDVGFTFAVPDCVYGFFLIFQQTLYSIKVVNPRCV
jgi:hypothetical protein